MTFLKKPFPESREPHSFSGVPTPVLCQLDSILQVAGEERFLEVQSYFLHGIHFTMGMVKKAALGNIVAQEDTQRVMQWLDELGWWGEK